MIRARSEQLGGHAWQTAYVAYGVRSLVQAVSEPARDKNRLPNLGLEKGPPSVLSFSSYMFLCGWYACVHVCV